MTKFPYWLGYLLGLLSRVGITLPGAIRRMRCANCGTIGIEQETHTNPFSPAWVTWAATATHRAGCGLPCSNGVGDELRLSELQEPVNLRMVHTAGKCPRCAPDLHGDGPVSIL